MKTKDTIHLFFTKYRLTFPCQKTHLVKVKLGDICHLLCNSVYTNCCCVTICTQVQIDTLYGIIFWQKMISLRNISNLIELSQHLLDFLQNSWTNAAACLKSRHFGDMWFPSDTRAAELLSAHYNMLCSQLAIGLCSFVGFHMAIKSVS